MKRMKHRVSRNHRYLDTIVCYNSSHDRQHRNSPTNQFSQNPPNVTSSFAMQHWWVVFYSDTIPSRTVYSSHLVNMRIFVGILILSTILLRRSIRRPFTFGYLWCRPLIKVIKPSYAIPITVNWESTCSLEKMGCTVLNEGVHLSKR